MVDDMIYKISLAQDLMLIVVESQPSGMETTEHCEHFSTLFKEYVNCTTNQMEHILIKYKDAYFNSCSPNFRS